MKLPPLTALEWTLAAVSAFVIGVSKSGFPGISLVNVVLMARVFPPRESTGIVLPLLVFGDILAVMLFKRHANWKHIKRTLPVALAGVVAGALLMGVVDDTLFRRLIGGIVLAMVLIQAASRLWPAALERHLRTIGFAWFMGAASGVATMVANAAGPVMTLYLLGVGLPKLEFAGTSAWFFLLINLFKLPFSWWLDLIHGGSLALDLVLSPLVVVGLAAGRRLVVWIPQRPFEVLLLTLAAAFALRFLGAF